MLTVFIQVNLKFQVKIIITQCFENFPLKNYIKMNKESIYIFLCDGTCL